MLNKQRAGTYFSPSVFGVVFDTILDEKLNKTCEKHNLELFGTI